MTDSTTRSSPRHRNARGEGGRLREDLIAAGRRLMTAAGREDAVTVRAVAREVGVAPQSFYLHYDGVESLLWDVYTREFSTLTDALARAAATEGDPRRRLQAISRAYCAFALQNPVAFRLLFSLPSRSHHTWEGNEPGRDAFMTLRSGVRDCVPTHGAETTKTASLLWAGLHGLAALRIDRPTFPWEPVDELVDDLLTALVPPSSSRADAEMAGAPEVVDEP